MCGGVVCWGLPLLLPLVQVEVQLSGFVKHLFTSAWVEILMMVLAILFYLGDSTTSVAHFVFIFVLHILRCACCNVCGCTCGIRDPDDCVACGRAPAVLWVLDRVPRFNAAGTCAVCAWRRACGLCSYRVHLSEQPSLSVTLATLWSRCVLDLSTRLLFWLWSANVGLCLSTRNAIALCKS